VDTATSEGLVQAPGTALRMSAAAFLAALERCLTFRTLLLRYALAFNEEVAQTAACNGRHVLEQRLACWILMAHDRAENDAAPHRRLKQLPHQIAVTEPPMPVLGEGGVVWYPASKPSPQSHL
jgi:hypothetical protein